MAESMAKKIAIITGGSRGLGRNTAIHLARRGVDVIAHLPFESDTGQNLSSAKSKPMGQKAAAFNLNAGDVPFIRRLHRWRSATLCGTGRSNGSITL